MVITMSQQQVTGWFVYTTWPDQPISSGLSATCADFFEVCVINVFVSVICTYFGVSCDITDILSLMSDLYLIRMLAYFKFSKKFFWSWLIIIILRSIDLAEFVLKFGRKILCQKGSILISIRTTTSSLCK